MNMKQEPTFERIFAHLSCSAIEKSQPWYAKFFGRGPDTVPMPGLGEWHHGDAAGLQLFENADDAGHGTLTIVVRDLRSEHSRLKAIGLEPSPIEPASSTSLIRIKDPDGNLIVLAQPGEV